MTNEIIYIILTAIFAFLVWLLQGHRTRLKLRHQIRKDITSWRKSLNAMENWIENHRENLENNKKIRPFYFEHSSFPVYENIISQLHLLSKKEIDGISSFYEWYRTFEHEILAFRDTALKNYDFLKTNEKLTNEKIAFAVYNTYRIEILRNLLLDNTDFKKIIEFKDNYDHQFKEKLKPKAMEIKEKYNVDVW